MDMSKIDKDIAEARACGREPVLLVGCYAWKELWDSSRIARSAGLPAAYNGAHVILNACNPDKCEVVVKE